MSNWEGTLIDLEFAHGKINHEAEDAKDYLIKQEEVALKHRETGAVVKLSDDGFIDVFAGPQVGVRVDPNTNTVNFFGDSVNVIASNFNVRTKPYGFNWNGKVFNPSLYTTSNGTMTTAKSKSRYSEGMINIMKDLGLPVEGVTEGE
ncbi:hypothetical protein QO179_24650 [Bacillus stercoris]|nr:hypothetical protein [Bacillus stercoris]